MKPLWWAKSSYYNYKGYRIMVKEDEGLWYFTIWMKTPKWFEFDSKPIYKSAEAAFHAAKSKVTEKVELCNG